MRTRGANEWIWYVLNTILCCLASLLAPCTSTCTVYSLVRYYYVYWMRCTTWYAVSSCICLWLHIFTRYMNMNIYFFHSFASREAPAISTCDLRSVIYGYVHGPGFEWVRQRATTMPAQPSQYLGGGVHHHHQHHSSLACSVCSIMSMQFFT